MTGHLSSSGYVARALTLLKGMKTVRTKNQWRETIWATTMTPSKNIKEKIELRAQRAYKRQRHRNLNCFEF
jgi:hypothetical protein